MKTSHSEMQKLRAEALAPLGLNDKKREKLPLSVKKYLRRTLPTLRQKRAEEVRLNFRAENKKADREIWHQGIPEQGRRYTEQPMINQQDRQTEIFFKIQTAKQSFEQMPDDSLIACLSNLVYGRSGESFKSSLPNDELTDILHLNAHAIAPLGRFERDKIEKVLLKAERFRLNDQKGWGTGPAESTERLRTDPSFLKSLNDHRLLAHAKELIQNSEFRASVPYSRYVILKARCQNMTAPLYQHERDQLINGISEPEGREIWSGGL